MKQIFLIFSIMLLLILMISCNSNEKLILQIKTDPEIIQLDKPFSLIINVQNNSNKKIVFYNKFNYFTQLMLYDNNKKLLKINVNGADIEFADKPMSDYLVVLAPKENYEKRITMLIKKENDLFKLFFDKIHLPQKYGEAYSFVTEFKGNIIGINTKFICPNEYVKTINKDYQNIFLIKELRNKSTFILIFKE